MLEWTTLVIFSVAFLYLGIPFLYGKWARMSLKQKAINAKSLVLTFDDGPGNRLTPAILRILCEHHAKATFFLLGKNIAGRESIVKQIIAAGHEVCSHGYDHLHQWKVSPLCAIRDIKRGWKAIDGALGTNNTKYAFRPPCGRLNIICLLYLLFCRVPIIYWSVDLGDTWMDKIDPNRIAHRAQKNGGAVSLAHDFDRSDYTLDSLIVESVRSALATAEQNGMQVLTCSQMLGYVTKKN